MKSTSLLTALGASLALSAASAMAAKPQSEMEQFSYAIGYQIGQTFKRDNLDIDTTALGAAIRDVLDGKEPQLSMVEMRSVMVSMQQKMQAKQQAQANKAKADGEAYLTANKTKTGVVTLDSGVQYKVISSGNGKQPSATDSITAHYTGTLLNGKVFDSSYQRNEPATFQVNQVIAGWQEVLPLMHEGDKWQVYIPAEHAYGENGAGPNIGPNETLIFDIELISVN